MYLLASWVLKREAHARKSVARGCSLVEEAEAAELEPRVDNARGEVLVRDRGPVGLEVDEARGARRGASAREEGERERQRQAVLAHEDVRRERVAGYRAARQRRRVLVAHARQEEKPRLPRKRVGRRQRKLRRERDLVAARRERHGHGARDGEPRL
jgi:hypothetical protein